MSTANQRFVRLLQVRGPDGAKIAFAVQVHAVTDEDDDQQVARLSQFAGHRIQTLQDVFTQWLILGISR